LLSAVQKRRLRAVFLFLLDNCRSAVSILKYPMQTGGRPKLRRNSAAGSGFAAVEVFCCQYRVDKIQEETDK
jgi:hypothetical protein